LVGAARTGYVIVEVPYYVPVRPAFFTACQQSRHGTESSQETAAANDLREENQRLRKVIGTPMWQLGKPHNPASNDAHA